MSFNQMLNPASLGNTSDHKILDYGHQRESSTKSRHSERSSEHSSAQSAARNHTSNSDSNSDRFNQAIQDHAKRSQRTDANADASKDAIESSKAKALGRKSADKKSDTDKTKKADSTSDAGGQALSDPNANNMDSSKAAMLALQLMIQNPQTQNPELHELASELGVKQKGDETDATTLVQMLKELGLNATGQQSNEQMAKTLAGAIDPQLVLAVHSQNTEVKVDVKTDAKAKTKDSATAAAGLQPQAAQMAGAVVQSKGASNPQHEKNAKADSDADTKVLAGDSKMSAQAALSSDSTQQSTQSFSSVINGAHNAAIPINGMTPQTQAAQQAPAAPDMNPMDKAVARQIDRAVVQQIDSNQKVLQLRLTPPELGTVKIEIVEHNGRIHVHLHAEDDSVRMSLERALPQLRQDMRGGNAPIADVQLSNQAFLNDNQRSPQFQQQQRRRQSTNGQTFSVAGMPEKQIEGLARQQGITIDQQGVHGLI